MISVLNANDLTTRHTRSNDLCVKRKRLNNETYSQVNAAVYKWFIQMRAKDIPLGGPVLKVKASEFATSFGCDDFKASEGWLGKFKTRHGILFKEVAGEENAVTADMTASSVAWGPGAHITQWALYRHVLCN